MRIISKNPRCRKGAAVVELPCSRTIMGDLRVLRPARIYITQRRVDAEFLDRIYRIKPRWVFSHKEQEHEEGGYLSRKEQERTQRPVRSFRIGALPRPPNSSAPPREIQTALAVSHRGTETQSFGRVERVETCRAQRAVGGFRIGALPRTPTVSVLSVALCE